MTWPRLWRLFQEPTPGSRWELEGEQREVWYVEGRRVVARVPGPQGATRSVRVPLGEWRCWWAFAKEVQR